MELATSCTVSVIVETIAWWLDQPAGAFDTEQVAKILDRLAGSLMLIETPKI